MNFKNDFDDYIQASTSRKAKNLSKKKKLEGTLPIVGNNSFGNYKMNPTQMFSMISSLNNSGILLNDQSSTMDKNSISVHHKPSNSMSVPYKGKPFSGMNTTMVNYVNDLDYIMMDGIGKGKLQMNTDQIHNYSVNNTQSKINKKKSLVLTSQKSSKRRSVERENVKSKHKRSASDGTRLVSSKGRKKDQSKSPPNQSAYYNKMIATFNKTGKFPSKSLRKVLNNTNKVYKPIDGILSKKESKEFNSKGNYFDPHQISKSNDARQKSSNIRSVPLSLMNSFERNAQEQALKKKYKNTNITTQKVPNQVFYHKGKVNVSDQHLKFTKPKSKSNVSQHSENPSHHFSKSLAFSGETTPISPFHQTSSKNSMRIGGKQKDKISGYQFIPTSYPQSSGSGLSYENMVYPSYHHPVFQRPETNVNVYDEEMSFASNNEKHHSFYQDISSSFASQTYDNPRKKSAKREVKGYSYCSESQNKKHKMIMDKKTKLSKMSEIMGTKDLAKKQKKEHKRQKSAYQSKL